MDQTMAESVYYTTLQYEEFSDKDNNSLRHKDDDKVFAKATKSTPSRDITKKGPQYFRYFIRVTSDRKPHDPFPKYSVSDNRSSFVNKVCKSGISYKEVPHSLFSKYISFLKTENNQWLNQVKRDWNN
jgi:hypothetical protein